MTSQFPRFTPNRNGDAAAADALKMRHKKTETAIAVSATAVVRVPWRYSSATLRDLECDWHGVPGLLAVQYGDDT